MGRNRQAVLAGLVFVALAAHAAFAQTPRDEAEAHFAQGEAYFQAKAFDKAAEEYLAAYALVPEAGLLFNTALAYENFGDAARAIAYYQRFLDEAPDASKTAEARARLEALTRILAAAEADKTRATEATQHRVDAARLSASGEHQAAITALLAAAELSTDPEITFELAEVYRAAGDAATALADYRRYLEAAPAGAHRIDATRAIEGIEHPPLRPRPSLLPAWGSYGVAAVSGAISVVYYRRASGIRRELEAALTAGAPPLDSSDPRFATGARAERIAQVTLAVSITAVVVGAVFTARSLLADRSPRRLSLQPTVDAGGAGVRLEGTW